MSYGLERVRFSYGAAPVLEDVSWRLPDRGVVGLGGASGCGKTTLLRLLAGLEQPAAGAVHCPERVSVLFQENRLLPWYTALENVARPPETDAARAAEMLAAVGLSAEQDSLPGNLSGGQCRRVALARALALPGELLLLDEPFTGLDEGSWKSVVPAILARAAAMPVVLVTHVAAEARALGAAIIPLEQPSVRGELKIAENFPESDGAPVAALPTERADG